MATQATVTMRRTFGGMLVAAICAGGLLAGAAGMPLAHAAPPTGARYAHLHPNPTNWPARRPGQRTPDPSMGPWRVGPIPISHLGRIAPDPINYPNHVTLKRMRSVARSSAFSQVVGVYIGETEKGIRTDPCPCTNCGITGASPTGRIIVIFHRPGGNVAQTAARRGPQPDLNPQPLPPRGDD